MTRMTKITCHMSMSLDGFVAGPDQSRENPLGVRGLELHQWHLGEPTHEADIAATNSLLAPRGAYVMGRNMFGPIRGDWNEDWRGWWGDDPPYHGTTFHFVTDGFDAALAQAREVAGDLDIDIAGGASTVRQAFAAGAVDELMLDISPVLLGSGESLFEGVEDPGLELLQVSHSPLAVHVRYRVGA
jgi:dihydrofolate reductase